MIDFEGVDVVVEDDRDDSSVRRAIGSALGVPESRVVVIADVSQYPNPESADVVVVTSLAGGQFAKVLSIQTSRRSLPYENPLDPMQRLCDELGTRCLVPDDSANPYSMWLVTRDEAPQRVGLAADELDEDRYVICEDR